jgi:hypothetical protein
MIKRNKQMVLRLTVLVLALMIIPTYSHGYTVANYGEENYTSNSGTTRSAGGSNIQVTAQLNKESIGAYIVEGAGAFLRSKVAMLQLLNKVEMSDLEGLDYDSLRADLRCAIENMEAANYFYTLLKSTAAITPYNPVMIGRLMTLDYNRFQKMNGLNADTFRSVKAYLSQGNVTGFFGNLQTRTEIILDMLYKLKNSTETDRFPSLQLLWSLAQQYSEFQMAGQYSAQVFLFVKNTVN